LTGELHAELRLVVGAVQEHHETPRDSQDNVSAGAIEARSRSKSRDLTNAPYVSLRGASGRGIAPPAVRPHSQPVRLIAKRHGSTTRACATSPMPPAATNLSSCRW
jgi:hypothetical protein